MITEEETITVLTACSGLLARIEASGQGIYYQPSDEDRLIIEGVMHVCTAYIGIEGGLALQLLRQRVDLSPSGWAMVRGMVEQYTLSLPGVAQRRIEELQAMRWWRYGGDAGDTGDAGSLN